MYMFSTISSVNILISKLLYPNIYSCLYSKNVNRIFNYASKDRKLYKKQMNIINLVQDHHIIPKQFSSHKVLKHINFNINDSRNIIIMPNTNGSRIFKLYENHIIHDGNHYLYNNYIKNELDIMIKYIDNDDDRLKLNFYLFHKHLVKNLVNNKGHIPW